MMCATDNKRRAVFKSAQSECGLLTLRLERKILDRVSADKKILRGCCANEEELPATGRCMVVFFHASAVSLFNLDVDVWVWRWILRLKWWTMIHW